MTKCLNRKAMKPLDIQATRKANKVQSSCSSPIERTKWIDAYIAAGGAWECADPKEKEVDQNKEPCPYDAPLPELTSIYCHEQLKLMAKRLSEDFFIASLVVVFGKDIPGKAYQELYRKLSDGRLTTPLIKVHRGLIKGHEAAYNSKDRKIHIVEGLVNEAVDKQLNNDASEKLFMVLLEEYGHYIDDMLRNEFHGKVGGDAKGDEGAIFAYRFAMYDITMSPRLYFADVKSSTYSGPLDIDYKELYEAAQLYTSPQEQESDDQDGYWEFFGAGYGDTDNHKSLAHRSIELVLADAGFDREEDLPRIYFGNWLRDFSQIVDPAIVRPADDVITKAQAHYKENSNSVHNSPAEDSLKLSRQTLTKIIGLLALKEFKADGDKLAFDFSKILRGPKGVDILGGYRPEEHIDNPMPGPLDEISEWVDNSKIDKVFTKPPVLKQLEINPRTGLKNYIATPVEGQSFPTAVQYMEDRLKKAMASGYTDEGLRYFGEGLHVLEDFFSHSNFVELSLIKVGKHSVYPWVDIPNGAQRIPLVTGLFGRTDVIGSIAPKLAGVIPHKMEPYESIPPGKRTDTDKLILLILNDLDKGQSLDSTISPLYKGEKDAKYVDKYNEYLVLRDTVNAGKGNKFVKVALQVIHTTFQAILVAINYPLSTVAGPLSHFVDDAQVWVDKFQNKSVGTNPTHSQLAKDHDDHHFHELAAILAQMAVRAVGDLMYSYFMHDYKTNSKPNEVIANPVLVAKQFIAHPLDVKWMDSTVKAWANGNPDKILRGESTDEIDHIMNIHGESIKKTVDNTYQELKDIKQVLSDLNKEYWPF